MLDSLLSPAGQEQLAKIVTVESINADGSTNPPLEPPSFGGTATRRPFSSLQWKVAFDPAVNKNSLVRTVLIILAEVMGAGVLALPRAFADLGWVLGSLSLVTFALTAIYAGFLLSKVLSPSDLTRDCMLPIPSHLYSPCVITSTRFTRPNFPS